MASSTATASPSSPRPYPTAVSPRGARGDVVARDDASVAAAAAVPPALVRFVSPTKAPAPALPPKLRSPAPATSSTEAEAATANIAASSAVVHPLSPAPDIPFLTARVHQHRQCVRLGKTFTEFEIRVVSASLRWESWKRYSQFASFHHELLRSLKRDPRTRALTKKVPKLPGSKLVGNLRSDFLERRLAELDTYLQTLVATEGLNMTIPVLAFLGALEGGVASSSSSSKQKTSAMLSHLHLDAVLPLLDAGDVVLFKTQGVLQGLQRKFTGSRYDHVGLVIRIPWGSIKPSSLHLLESTSDGVRTYNLMRRMRAWHLCGAVVAVRQLKCRRNNTFLSDLDAFVSDVDGLPYGLTLGKLLRREPGQSKDNFFCSELVATAYMRVGLIDAAVCSASSFFPSSFNQENSDAELRLQGGAELGAELLVDFILPAVGEARANESGEESPAEDDFPFQRPLEQRGSNEIIARRRGMTSSRAEGGALWAPLPLTAGGRSSSAASPSPVPSPPSTSDGPPFGGRSYAQTGLTRGGTDSPFSNHTPTLESDDQTPLSGRSRSSTVIYTATVTATTPSSTPLADALSRNRSAALSTSHFDAVSAQFNAQEAELGEECADDDTPDLSEDEEDSSEDIATLSISPPKGPTLSPTSSGSCPDMPDAIAAIRASISTTRSNSEDAPPAAQQQPAELAS